MKKVMFIIPAIIAAAFFIGCSDDKAKLGFINHADSDGAINEIVWADGDAKWETEGGYAKETPTGAKEVDKNTGSVSCMVMSGTSFVDAEVKFPNDSNSLALSGGAENIYTLKATVSDTASVKNKK